MSYYKKEAAARSCGYFPAAAAPRIFRPRSGETIGMKKKIPQADDLRTRDERESCFPAAKGGERHAEQRL